MNTPISRAFLLCVLLVACRAPLCAENAPAPWQPKMAPASDDAENAIKAFKVPKDLIVELFAAEPLLAHPVSICTDSRGRFYIAETWRFADGTNGGAKIDEAQFNEGKKLDGVDFGALDLRGHMDWLEQDLASKTPADREAILRRNLGPRAKQLEFASEIVRLVEDTKGTGRADKSTIFADGFNSILDGVGAGVLAYKGSVYYTCIPNLWRLQDTKGTGKADVKEVLQTGFGARIAFLGHDLHGLTVGPDGKIYFSVGDRGYNVKAGGKQYICPERGGVFRCNPDGSEFEIVASGLRNPQKLAFDKYGNLFTADNNADRGDSARWVYIVEGGETGWRGGYQFIDHPNPLGPWSSEKLWNEAHEGQPAYIVPPIKDIGQGPSGIAYYPGTGCLPERYENHFFYCDFTGNGGIFTFSLKPKGAGFEYAADTDREFFFRNQATDLCFGIDGAAYACVWVSGITKTGKGRIYRILDPTKKNDADVLETKKLLGAGMQGRTTEELLKLLEHKDMRVRQAAQFALADWDGAMVEGAGNSFEPALNSTNQLARLHAIWGRGQVARKRSEYGPMFWDISKLSNELLKSIVEGERERREKMPFEPWRFPPLDLLPLLDDTDDEVVAQAAKVLGDSRTPKAHDAFVKLLKHENLRVRFFAAYGLGKLQSADAIDPLCAALRENADKDPFLRHACVMALYWIAEKYPDLVLEKSNDDSASVRMAVLLVLRRMEDARIAKFLKDKSPLLVAEAARAINDVPIPAAFKDLAALAAPPDKPKDGPAYTFKAEFWENIPGNSVNDLTKNKKFPDQPDSTMELDIFEQPVDRAENFGSRISGVITAPQSGDYIFWISVDDAGQLFLSTDETPANKKLLCECKVPQWTKSREWEKYPNQKSAPVKLEAGKKYYIEALMKEAGVGDNLAVGWQLPDGTRQRPIGNVTVEEPPAIVRRALNANFRLGSADNAHTLATFAARRDNPAPIRVEVLTMLGEWAAPPARDKIMNLVRPLPERDPAPAVQSLAPHVEALLKTVGTEIPVATARAAARLHIKEAAPALHALFNDTKKHSDIRVASLNALFDLNADNVYDCIRKAAISKDANLKKAGTVLMAKTNPKDALVSLKSALEDEKTPVVEQQNALAILSEMKSEESDDVIATCFDKLLDGKVKPEVELDVTEAARKSPRQPVKDRLARYTASIPHNGHRSVELSDFKSALVGGDAEAGRKIFYDNASAQCIRCHKINGFGGQVGPELTGIGKREKREHILESIVDPSAKIAKGYETIAIKTADGKVHTGVLKSEDDKKLVLAQSDGKSVDIPKDEIKVRRNQEESTMPQAGTNLGKFEIRNLVEYLSTLK